MIDFGPEVPYYAGDGTTIWADAESSEGPDGILLDGLVEVRPGAPRYAELAALIAARL